MAISADRQSSRRCGTERPHNGIAVEHFLPAGPFAILPMTGNRSSIVWTERAELAPRLIDLPDAAFAGSSPRALATSSATVEPIGPRWTYPLALLLAERYIAPRLALVGEAAHMIHPIAGQGLNLGIRDVAALAELVIDARRLGLDIGDAAVLRALPAMAPLRCARARRGDRRPQPPVLERGGPRCSSPATSGSPRSIDSRR